MERLCANVIYLYTRRMAIPFTGKTLSYRLYASVASALMAWIVFRPKNTTTAYRFFVLDLFVGTVTYWTFEMAWDFAKNTGWMKVDENENVEWVRSWSQ